MKPTQAIALACALSGTVSTNARAQFWERMTNPKVTIVVNHPPRVTLKGVTKISVLEFTGVGRCGAEFSERMSDMISRSNKFELIDRSSIDAVLHEQGFQSSGAVSPSAAVKLGALLGPSAAFTGRVSRCAIRVADPQYSDYQDNKGRVTRTWYHRTSAQFTASISLIDLTTGKVLAREMVEASDTIVNTSQEGVPEAPSEDAVLTNTYQKGLSAVHRMIFPWPETISTYVHNDKKCDLLSTAEQIKRANFDVAAAALRTSIAAECGSPGDKDLLSKAYYNLGIALTYSGKPRDGLEALQMSASLRNNGITDESIAAVRQMLAVEAQRSRAEANALELGASSASASLSASNGASSKPQAGLITNKEIIDLVKAKMGDAIIINSLRNSPCKLDVTPTALIRLKQSGASNALILEVTDAAAKRCK